MSLTAESNVIKSNVRPPWLATDPSSIPPTFFHDSRRHDQTKKLNLSCALWYSWNLTLAPQPEDSGEQEEENTQEYYDPVAAAANAWGDDASQPVRYDPIAAATEGWGDDGTQPVRHDSVADEEGGDDENQQAGQDPVAEVQEEVESQPIIEEEEDTQAEASVEASEEEAPQVAAALDNEEGQVTVGEQKKMHLDNSGGCIYFWAWEINRRADRRSLRTRVRMHLVLQFGCIGSGSEGMLDKLIAAGRKRSLDICSAAASTSPR